MSDTMIGRLGVLTGRGQGPAPVTEPEFVSRLSQLAPRFGLELILFPPEGVASDGSIPHGYVRTPSGWKECASPAPGVLYNRFFPADARERRAAGAALNALRGAVPLSRGLPDKWRVHRHLAASPAAGLLPETHLYSGRGFALMLAEREGGVFLKPAAGSQGRGVLRAVRLPGGGLRLAGRDAGNRSFVRDYADEAEGGDTVRRFTAGRPYLLQPCLPLCDSAGRPFDLRVLAQKDGRARWTISGMAVRLGRPGTAASNLHGGGTAVPPEPFLAAEFGPGAAAAVLRDVREAAAGLPPLLEAGFGRLGELGLDFGIDPGGRIWLLEANSKPGRTVFRLTGDTEAERRAAENPLRYARCLLQSRRPAAFPRQ
ncbi:YheC/YheD family endospore coat-associated protein [Paenibacillus glufosinatiresistens]|uniref:YheC/YheD family endospore coat-associated protein n=1 Tax=Paenibacillus glufosinatiresistens TaxID=3070657 RepID=UPI00286E097D|nr:YheC/YheD family protein [Paenibacillus sp. YX.27]